jgi:hypothetical protein
MFLAAGSYGKGTLQETQPFEYKIVEARGTSKRKGVLMSLEGTFQRADTKNANGRVYPSTLWDKALSNEEITERINKRRMLGELDHPASGATSLSRVSHVITHHNKLADGRIFGKMDILDTPHGQIAATLFEAGCQIGISSRGDGSVENVNGTDEVQGDYRLETYDLVLKPSTPGAFPQMVESEEDQKKNQELIASAVEGLVNGTSDVEVLLECHKIISVLEGCDARCEGVLGSIKQKLGKTKDVEHKPPESEVTEMTTQPVPTPTDAPPGFNLSPEMKDFLQEWVNKGVAEAMAAKQAEIAKLNERIANLTEQNEDTASKLSAAEQLIDEFSRKVKELGNNQQTDEELTKRYDAAVKLLDEAVSRLQEMGDLKRRYEAAEQLLAASLRRHQDDAMADAMADMFEEAGIEDEEELKHYSELLGMCETIEEMKVKFESIQSLRESREDDDHVVREPLPPTQNRQLQEQQYTPQPAQPKDFITTRLISRMCG